MNKRVRSGFIALFFLSNLFSVSLTAGEFVVDDVTVHYSLVNSSVIEPKVATQYNLKRSKNRALLNISVVKNLAQEAARNGEVKGLMANVFGQAVSLAGHLKELNFQEIKEQNAVYYIATFSISNGERLSFDLKVQPNKVGKLIPIKFKQQVYTN